MYLTNESLNKAVNELKKIKSFNESIISSDFRIKGITRDFKRRLKNIMYNADMEFALECLLNDIYYYGDCSTSSILVELTVHIVNVINLLNLKLSIYDFPFPFDFLEEVEERILNF